MTDDLIARVETQLSSVVTSSAGVPTEKTIRDYGRTPVCREDIEALIAYVRELEAQAARDAEVVDAAKVLIDRGASTRSYVWAGVQCCFCGVVRGPAGYKHYEGCEWQALDAALAARGKG